ncbi:MAG: hypothetical protein COW65_09710 [Cytophagales bacterium CG18_big_fil_WC_8_21_14_2_50_42_9]|nr:MAG: hypothetical protein COW65_09710 [Cytophagales bacterium CG18_big_fil_WC_8_21_14_2_50_42_9]
MSNIGIIEENFGRLQELKTFINTQEELAVSFAVQSEAGLNLLSCSHPVPVVLMGTGNAIPAKTVGNRIRIIQQKVPGAAIIVLSEADQMEVVLAALRAGALGYLYPNTPFSQIKEVIFHVLAGGAFLSPAIARKITDYFRQGEQPELCSLTSREKEIVSCLTEGLTYKMIAVNLGLSIDTVRFHLRNIYKKLQVKSKGAVISKVLKQERLVR